MPKSSWIFKSSLASTYFRPAPEGKIFVCPPPWIFGKPRSYHLTDAQAEQLVSRFARAYSIGLVVFIVAMIAAIVGGVGLVYALSANPDRVFADHPIAFYMAIVLTMLVMGAVYLVSVRRAVRSVIGGLPWTPTAREPYSLPGNLKRITAIYMVFPTWLLAVLFALFLIEAPITAYQAIKALADGHLTMNLLQTVLYFAFAAMTGIALVEKRKAQRESRASE